MRNRTIASLCAGLAFTLGACGSAGAQSDDIAPVRLEMPAPAPEKTGSEKAGRFSMLREMLRERALMEAAAIAA